MINIVLPEGKGIKTGDGTRVFTADGAEITGITHIEISISPSEIITCKLSVYVDQIKNVEGIASLLPADQAEQILKWAYKLSQQSGRDNQKEVDQ
jgi:hypothetical protein